VNTRSLLEHLFWTAVRAAEPARCLPRNLPDPPASGRLILLAAGKAAASMAEVAERHYLDRGFPAHRMGGLAVTRYGYSRPTQVIPVIEAGHPVPDAASVAAAERALALAAEAGPQDLVLALVSGGASANWTAPVSGVSLAEKQSVTRALLRCGASIAEINAVRKHLSRIKGGRLAVRAHPAAVVTLAISDVPGDDPTVIGSGPTVPDPSTLNDARAILARHALTPPASVMRALADPANETPKSDHPALVRGSFRLVARPAEVFRAVEEEVRRHGYECIFLGDSLEGEARSVAKDHARLALEMRSQRRRAAILSGGELTVTVTGRGKGGPNQEYALALALALAGSPGVTALSADTDGTDGGGGRPDDPAGAFIDDTTLVRASALGLDPAAFLLDNDSARFFSRLGDALVCGPTFTNVNDFRVILVDTA
jgi:glycerate 2-kinase